jgi:hypothetical protein
LPRGPRIEPLPRIETSSVETSRIDTWRART